MNLLVSKLNRGRRELTTTSPDRLWYMVVYGVYGFPAYRNKTGYYCPCPRYLFPIIV